jgi:hypothetical protein
VASLPSQSNPAATTHGNLALAGVYVPFTDIGAAVLRMLANTRGITVSDADAAELTDRFASMAPHPDFAPGLSVGQARRGCTAGVSAGGICPP